MIFAEEHSFGAEACDISVFWFGMCVGNSRVLKATRLSARIHVHVCNQPFYQMQCVVESICCTVNVFVESSNAPSLDP